MCKESEAQIFGCLVFKIRHQQVSVRIQVSLGPCSEQLCCLVFPFLKKGNKFIEMYSSALTLTVRFDLFEKSNPANLRGWRFAPT